jgi:hypothetical protein
MPDFPSQNMPFQIYVFFPPAAEKSLKVKLAVARFSQDHEGPAFCTGSTACLAGNYCGASHKQCLNLQSPDGMRCATVTHTVPCLYAGPADFCVEESSIFVCHLCLGKLAGAAFWESWAAAPPAETKAYLQMARSVHVPCASNQSHGRQRPHSKLHNMMLFLLSCLF